MPSDSDFEQLAAAVLAPLGEMQRLRQENSDLRMSNVMIWRLYKKAYERAGGVVYDGVSNRQSELGNH